MNVCLVHLCSCSDNCVLNNDKCTCNCDGQAGKWITMNFSRDFLSFKYEPNKFICNCDSKFCVVKFQFEFTYIYSPILHVNQQTELRM